MKDYYFETIVPAGVHYVTPTFCAGRCESSFAVKEFKLELKGAASGTLPLDTRSSEKELKNFFSMKTFLTGRNTPARYLTDRILNIETEILLESLNDSDPEVRADALARLKSRKQAIESAINWKSGTKTVKIPRLDSIVIDGVVTEWNGAAVWSGSYSCHPVASETNSGDKSCWYAALHGKNICFAGFFPGKDVSTDPVRPWTKDGFEVFFTAPGNGWQYFEFIVTPDHGIALSKLQNYTGTGTRIETRSGFAADMGVTAAGRRLPSGFSVEISIPMELFKIDNGEIGFMLVRTDSSDGSQKTPVPNVTEGHNLFGFMRGAIQ
ncbi:MAG: hypothetical protein L6W00_30465 [Lentisphaeria bacterium]|nr:MAG: hypothetical protein L6W00_30465 [Lentisphaeria bacterium]